MHKFPTTLLTVLMVAAVAACTGGSADQTASAPIATPTPTAAESEGQASHPPTATPARSSSTATSPSPSAHDEPGFGDAAECENPELGYRVEYPAGWWANDLIDPGEDDPGFTPIIACTYFAPDPVELQPNAGLPSGIAVQFGAADAEPVINGEILEEEAVPVDGREAVRRVEQPEPSPGFIPEGSLIYRYLIELDDGTYLMASTDNILQDDAAYEESRRVLDTMMDELDVED